MKYRVELRRNFAEIKENAKQIDGKTYNFVEGWVMNNEDTSLYIGEMAMVPRDENYPMNAPDWIASGDLVEVQ